MGERKTGRKLIVFFGLIALTVAWSILWFNHVNAYNQMKAEDIERLGEEIAKLLDYEPVWLYGLGNLLLMIGFLIAVAWSIPIYQIVKKTRKKTNGKAKLLTPV